MSEPVAKTPKRCHVCEKTIRDGQKVTVTLIACTATEWISYEGNKILVAFNDAEDVIVTHEACSKVK